jgi:hypothetical protein
MLQRYHAVVVMVVLAFGIVIGVTQPSEVQINVVRKG